MTFAVMSGIMAKLGRKTLSLGLIFNSVVSLAPVANILVAFYLSTGEWRPYSPYLIDGSLFWLVIVTAVLNIVPAKLVGRVDFRRVLFHHYVYGFLASSISLMLMAVFAPAYIFVFLMPSLGFQTTGLQMVMVYSGLFFVYGGLTLMIDDIHDVSLRLGRALDRLKIWAYKSSKTLQKVHLISSLVTVYTAMSVCAWFLENNILTEAWSLWDVSSMVFAASLLITGFWGLKAIKAKYWFSKLYLDLSKLEPTLHKK
jgi:hypothetical protein